MGSDSTVVEGKHCGVSISKLMIRSISGRYTGMSGADCRKRDIIRRFR